MADALHFVDANGLKFAYLEEGTGPLVLMLHGFPDTAHTWDDLRSRIAAKGYRAVSPFMRGYHPTAIPDRDADQETLARDALALIGALGASEAVIIGHDFGAGAAYGAAALPASCGRWSPDWSPDPKEFDPVRASFSNRASLNAAFGYYRKLSPIPTASLKARITMPTVVFAGLDDPTAEPADYRAAARMFAGDYIVEEVDGGHFMHREHPDAFAERLLAHL